MIKGKNKEFQNFIPLLTPKELKDLPKIDLLFNSFIYETEEKYRNKNMQEGISSYSPKKLVYFSIHKHADCFQRFEYTGSDFLGSFQKSRSYTFTIKT